MSFSAFRRSDDTVEVELAHDAPPEVDDAVYAYLEGLGGRWNPASQEAVVRVVRCTDEACTYRWDRLRRPHKAPEACPLCDAPVTVEGAPRSPQRVTWTRVEAPSRQWLAEQRLRRTPNRAAASGYALAVAQGEGLDVALVGELVAARMRELKKRSWRDYGALRVQVEAALEHARRARMAESTPGHGRGTKTRESAQDESTAHANPATPGAAGPSRNP